MKKLKQDLGKRVFGKGLPRGMQGAGAALGEFLDVFHFVGHFFTAGVHSPRPCLGRLGQSDCRGYFPFSPAAPKSFVHATETVFPPATRRARRISARPVSVFNIGGSSTPALSPQGCQFGRSMVEMLGVLAIIGVLSVAAGAGLWKGVPKI